MSRGTASRLGPSASGLAKTGPAGSHPAGCREAAHYSAWRTPARKLCPPGRSDPAGLRAILDRGLLHKGGVMTWKRNFLVVANVTATSEELIDALQARAKQETCGFTLVIPAT